MSYHTCGIFTNPPNPDLSVIKSFLPNHYFVKQRNVKGTLFECESELGLDTLSWGVFLRKLHSHFGDKFLQAYPEDYHNRKLIEVELKQKEETAKAADLRTPLQQAIDWLINKPFNREINYEIQKYLESFLEDEKKYIEKIKHSRDVYIGSLTIPLGPNGININEVDRIMNEVVPKASKLYFPGPCGICGGTKVLIRGKFPNEPKQLVCPTCTAERLEQINEISSKHGESCKLTKQ